MTRTDYKGFTLITHEDGHSRLIKPQSEEVPFDATAAQICEIRERNQEVSRQFMEASNSFHKDCILMEYKKKLSSSDLYEVGVELKEQYNHYALSVGIVGSFTVYHSISSILSEVDLIKDDLIKDGFTVEKKSKEFVTRYKVIKNIVTVPFLFFFKRKKFLGHEVEPIKEVFEFYEIKACCGEHK